MDTETGITHTKQTERTKMVSDTIQQIDKTTQIYLIIAVIFILLIVLLPPLAYIVIGIFIGIFAEREFLSKKK